jgi:hypothetical protein
VSKLLLRYCPVEVLATSRFGGGGGGGFSGGGGVVVPPAGIMLSCGHRLRGRSTRKEADGERLEAFIW